MASYQYSLDPAVLKAVEDKVRALALAKSPTGEVTVRMGTAQDLGVANAEWLYTTTVQNAWDPMIAAYTIPDNTYVGIVAVFDYTPIATPPAMTTVRVQAGGSFKRLWALEDSKASAQGNLMYEAFDEDEVIILADSTVVTIDAWVNAAALPENIGFVLVIGEPKGRTIDKS
jgi:hypothetical protein